MMAWWIVRAARDDPKQEIPERAFQTEADAKLALATYRVVQREYEQGQKFVESFMVTPLDDDDDDGSEMPSPKKWN